MFGKQSLNLHAPTSQQTAIPPNKNTAMKWLGFIPASYPLGFIHRSSESSYPLDEPHYSDGSGLRTFSNVGGILFILMKTQGEIESAVSETLG